MFIKNNPKILSKIALPFYKFRRLNGTTVPTLLNTTRTITQDDVDQFAKITGDYNPIHSREAPVDKKCVHGAFLNGIVSGIIGTRLPGPGTVVVSQSFSFPNKCVCDEEIKITVKMLDDRKIKKVTYECVQNDKIVFNGTANVMKR